MGILGFTAEACFAAKPAHRPHTVPAAIITLKTIKKLFLINKVFTLYTIEKLIFLYQSAIIEYNLPPKKGSFKGHITLYNLFAKISEDAARQLSPVTLAFVGDAVYSLYIRSKEVLCCDAKLAQLQKHTSDAVSAKGQSLLLNKIEKYFSPDEAEIFHRGRNAKKATKSKNASVTDYNRSTGFEAVLGYLYLSGNYERISQLIEGGEQ